MAAFTDTFDEVIKVDKNFSSLLTKIKQAYDEYLTKMNDKINSNNSNMLNETPKKDEEISEPQKISDE